MATSLSATLSASKRDELSINTLRFLAVDAVEKANSGHPGMPVGAAPMAYVLWTRLLRHNPSNPHWFDRDRFVLSAGHGSMLLYGLLHLTGYDLPLSQLMWFRRWGSHTPGHPELNVTSGVEVTTGPLGQGFGNAVGLAMAEAHLAARYNRPGFDVIRHFTYVLASDGDLMEGISSEAGSLAGHLKLGRLICLYDANRVTLSASTDLTFSENVLGRFEAFGWHTQSVDDGNDLDAIETALRTAQDEHDRPSLIGVRTHIGYGAPHKQDTFEAHGSPLGEEEVKLAKQRLDWPTEPLFYVPEEALEHYRQAVPHGEQLERDWETLLGDYAGEHPELAQELRLRMRGQLPADWAADVPTFPGGTPPMATRIASGRVLNAIARRLPAVVGGSADLNPSTFTVLEDQGDFESPQRKPADTQGTSGGPWSYAGRNLHFGVREHVMGAALNGLAAHGGFIPYGATFLNFSDYMRPPMRLAAIMSLHVVYVFTHDSIGLGEDGPTHQPIEQLLGLRAIPSMIVIRPADANETTAAWQVAIEQTQHPVALVLTRQKVPVLDPAVYRGIAGGVRAGAYVLVDGTNGVERARGDETPRLDLILLATGSEVHLALAARDRLAGEGRKVRVVSMPSWNLFARQSESYRRSVLPQGVPTLPIEAGTPLGWRSYTSPEKIVLGIDRFGASAPGNVVMDHYGFNVDTVCQLARDVLSRNGQSGG